MKTIKTSRLLFLVIILPIYLFPISGAGQSYAHIHNEDPDGILPVEGCDYQLNFTLTVANLEKHSSPDTDGFYQLPKGYEAIYVTYSIDGTFLLGSANLSDFKYDLDFTTSANNGIKYYTATHMIGQVDFAERCTSANEDEKTKVPYTIEIRTSGGGAYPICQYTSIDDIFACNAFNSTNNYCDNQASSPLDISSNYISCHSTKLAFVFDKMNIKCRACSDINTEEEIILNTQQLFETVTLSPNPFNDVIQLSWTNSDLIEEVHLFNTTGKRLVSQHLSNQSENLYFNTTNLPSGFYYLEVKNQNRNKVFKLVKH